MRFQFPVRDLATEGTKRKHKGVKEAPFGMGQRKSKSLGSRDPRGGRPKRLKGSNLPEIPPDNPLGVMLEFWDEEKFTQCKSKEKMIQYCMVEWTKEEIRLDDIYWPVFGTFDDWTCQVLNLYVNGKEPFCQEEMDYAACWRGSSKMIGLYALKKKEDEKSSWDPLEALPPPYHGQPPSPAENIFTAPTAPAPPTSLPSSRTRSKTMSQEELEGESEAKLHPLREVPMGGNVGGIGFVTAPLNTGDVRNFKKDMGKLLDDPIGVSEGLDQFLGPNIYTWEELQSIMSILFTAEEREMIRVAGMRDWERRHQQGPRGT